MHGLRQAGLALCAGTLSVLSAARASADEPTASLRYDLTLDLAVTGGGALAWAGTEAFKKELGPARCRWCDRAADGTDSLNGLDAGMRHALKWQDTRAADKASSLLAFGLAPLVAVGGNLLIATADGHNQQGGVDALLVLETAVISADLNQAVKFLAARERPFVHFMDPEDRPHTAEPADNNLSFFSGHTMATFALATSAGTVASMRHYRLAPVQWAAGLTVATATGYLRIAADKHYFTDVLVGAIVGAGVGFALPYVFHRPSNASDASSPAVLTPSVEGKVFGFSGVW